MYATLHYQLENAELVAALEAEYDNLRRRGTHGALASLVWQAVINLKHEPLAGGTERIEIGLKSGACIALDVTDAAEVVRKISEAKRDAPTDAVLNLVIDLDIFVDVREVSFVIQRRKRHSTRF